MYNENNRSMIKLKQLIKFLTHDIYRYYHPIMQAIICTLYGICNCIYNCRVINKRFNIVMLIALNREISIEYKHEPLVFADALN